jgi:hypothetical protein
MVTSDEHPKAPGLNLPVPPTPPQTHQQRWVGIITAIQPRAWVWRYKHNYRTHHLTGFNLWISGDDGKVVVAISGLQQQKLGFRLGDTVAGTAWPVPKGKREIADLYRAGNLKIVKRSDHQADRVGPPFIDIVPAQEIYQQRGCRMLDATLWRTTCMTCMWANKSRVEVEVVFGKSKRYRSETFCYGPRSCSVYAMGEPRSVPFRESWNNFIQHDHDDGLLDSCLTDHRGEND